MKLPYISEEDLISLLQKSNLYSEKIKKALVQAKHTHKDVTRDLGTPYLEEHIYSIVEEIIKANYLQEKIIIAALLHDVLEDDDEMTDQVFIQEFGQEIYDIVKPLTKPKRQRKLTEEEKKELNKKMVEQAKQSCFATKIIRIADRYNNATCSLNATGEKHKRILQETKDLYLPFAKEVSVYFYEKMEELFANFG